MQLLHYCLIAVLWIHRLRVMLLVQGRGEMAVLPAVVAVLVRHSAMGKNVEGNVVRKGQRGNGVSACSYCSTVTSHCYGYMD